MGVPIRVFTCAYGVSAPISHPMHAPLRHLVASLGLFGAATLMANVTAVWTGAADDQFINPANWQAAYVPDTSSGVTFSTASYQQLAIAASTPVDPIVLAGANPTSALGDSITKLSGSGTFTEPVIVGSGVIQAPGNSPGIQTYANGLTLASGGQLSFEVQSAGGPPGSGYDLVRISGGLLDITSTSSAPFTIKVISLTGDGTPGAVSDFSASNSYSWMLYEGNTAGGIAGFAADKFTLDLSSFSNPTGTGIFSLSQGTNSANPAIFLNFTAVPEPSTYALLALGLGVAVVARLRRR